MRQLKITCDKCGKAFWPEEFSAALCVRNHAGAPVQLRVAVSVEDGVDLCPECLRVVGVRALQGDKVENEGGR